MKTRHAELTEISRRAAKLFMNFGLALSGDGSNDLTAVQQELARTASAAAKTVESER